MKLKHLSVLTVTLSFLVIAACSNFDNTSAPDFNYESGQSLPSKMQQLALQLQLLDWSLSRNSSGQDGRKNMQQQEVLSILRRMDSIGSNVLAEEISTSHQFLQNYMDDFLLRVDQASTTAADTPPSYYLAGQVSGGCTNCHKVRDMAQN